MNKLRCLLIGYGNMGKNWREVLIKKSSIEVVGVVDVIEQNRRQAAIDFSLDDEHTGDSLEELLARFSPDFVIDCSAPHAHQSNTLTTLRHGSDILGEKPIASSLAEAQEVVDLAREQRKLYMVNQNYRWRPIMTVLKEYLQASPIGKIQSINILYAQNFEFKDTFRHKISSPLLQDMAVHHFDLVRSLTGANFETVYCVETCPQDSNFKDGASATAIFTLTSGIAFTYQGSWSEIGHSTSFMGSWRIACERGTILWNGSDNPEVEHTVNGALVRHELSLPESFVPKSENVFLHELETTIDNFIDALTTQAAPETGCGDNIHTLNMVLSAIKSSKERRIITNNLNLSRGDTHA